MINLKNIDQIDIRDKKVTVIGLGLSGTESAKLANQLGARVFATDISSKTAILNNAIKLMHDFHIATETGLHSEKIYDSDLWILSPGVAKNTEIVIKAIEKNIPIVSEIEFASWFTQSPIIAITGSNGKTTTSHILNEMCQSKKINGVMAGNMGLPFSERVFNELSNPDRKRIYVLECSSFQMEFVKHFTPYIALFTNISPDHLDRHSSMSEYIKMKLKMIQNIKPDSFIVFNAEDKILYSSLKKYKLNLKPYGINTKDAMFKVENDEIISPSGSPLIKLKKLGIPGKHNLYNFLSAATCAHLLGIKQDQITKVLKSFKGVEHRLEFVSNINDVDYINDSKATNINSVIVALKSFSKPVILILGGYNKGANFQQLLPHIKSSNVKNIICYGEAGEQINTAIGDAVRSVQVTDLSSAVNEAHILAAPGDIVLLSPGCASFDEFSDFESRGTYFKSAVQDLQL